MTTRRGRLLRLTWVALGSLVFAAGGVPAGPPDSEWEPGESISGQTGPCGYGPWYVDDRVTFSHPVAFTVALTSTSGYLIDCTIGADAYLELRQYQPGVYYRYAVWGQLGDYK